MRETLGVLLGFFLAAVLGYLISEIAQKEQEKEVLESYMDSLQEIYEVIRQRMDVTRKFRHDLLSHVQTLEYLIEKQKNPDGELRKYADQLTETYRKIQKGTFCRDEITDAFLMMEKQVCIEKEIPFQIQVSKTCMEWMMPVERIGFLHNLLDNAIEANGRIPEKERKELSFWIEEDSDSCTVKLSAEEHCHGWFLPFLAVVTLFCDPIKNGERLTRKLFRRSPQRSWGHCSVPAGLRTFPSVRACRPHRSGWRCS